VQSFCKALTLSGSELGRGKFGKAAAALCSALVLHSCGHETAPTDSGIATLVDPASLMVIRRIEMSDTAGGPWWATVLLLGCWSYRD
jgi:hypothetical protein